MLPYRLRPPVYGGRLKKLKDKESFLDRTYPYREGGPIERAVKADLRALLPNFEEKLQELRAAAADSATGNDNDDDDDGTIAKLADVVAAGTAFRAFKDVFGSAKVAMLHRSSDISSSSGCVGFLPQRCDRSAYSQLLYAACLSMLRDAFRSRSRPRDDAGNDSSPQHSAFLRQAAFCVFALYALYETNSLPRCHFEPSMKGMTKEEWLAMLPMGLQNRENPKMMYRRAFLSPIRIDAEHYGYLLQLRDLAMAACCQSEATRWNRLKSSCLLHNSSSNSSDNDGDDDDDDDSKAYDESSAAASSSRPLVTTASSIKLDFAVATDLCAVLDRILSGNMLEFCAYTGPCGLEGMAGHEGYPFPATPSAAGKAPPPTTVNNNDSTGTAAAAAAADSNNNNAATTSNDDAAFAFSRPLEEHLQNYLSSRQAIRLPAMRKDMSQKSKRIREALLPIFLQDSEQSGAGNDPVSQLLSACRGEEQGEGRHRVIQKRIKLRHRHVSFGAVFFNDGPGSTASVPFDVEAVNGGDSVVGKQSLSSLPDDPETNNANHSSYELILPIHLSAEQQESLHAAVQMLLDRDESLILPRSGDAEQTPSHVDEATKDCVSTLGDGGVSVAGSSLTGAGRGALRALLAHAQSTVPSLPARGSATFNPLSAGDFFLEAGSSTKAAVAGKRTPVGEDDENSHLSDMSSDEGNDQVSVAASRVGQNALQALLDTSVRKSRRKQSKPRSGSSHKPAATRKKKHNGRTSQPSRSVARAPSGNESENGSTQSSWVERGKSALDALLAKVVPPTAAAERATNDDESESDSSESSFSSSESAGRGRSALDALLANAMRHNGKN